MIDCPFTKDSFKCFQHDWCQNHQSLVSAVTSVLAFIHRYQFESIGTRQNWPQQSIKRPDFFRLHAQDLPSTTLVFVYQSQIGLPRKSGSRQDEERLENFFQTWGEKTSIVLAFYYSIASYGLSLSSVNLFRRAPHPGLIMTAINSYLIKMFSGVDAFDFYCALKVVSSLDQSSRA